jgi:hypothetical protein
MNQSIICDAYMDWYDSVSTNHLRFGQYFLIKYFPNITAPEIFYEENPDKAFTLIVESFCNH